jgi:hypothetical protein
MSNKDIPPCSSVAPTSSVAVIFGFIAFMFLTLCVFYTINIALYRKWKASPCNGNCECQGAKLLHAKPNRSAAISPRDNEEGIIPRISEDSAGADEVDPVVFDSPNGPPPYGSSSHQAREDRRLLDDDPLSK